jgi:hypothetical protein
MLHRVALVRSDVSEELCPSFIRVTGIGELGTTIVTVSVVPSSPILVTLMKEAQSSSETSVLTRATRRNIPEDVILHSHRRKNLKSYTENILVVILLQERRENILQIWALVPELCDDLLKSENIFFISRLARYRDIYSLLQV